MRILGVDPGYERMGIAIIERIARAREALVYSSCVRTDAKLLFDKRLYRIGKAFEECILKYHPDGVAIETLYVSTNQRTAMRVSEVRGALIFIAASHGLPIFEYTPLQVKSAISGSGRADKKVVERMVTRLIDVPPGQRLDDEYDAIAIALTALASERSLR